MPASSTWTSSPSGGGGAARPINGHAAAPRLLLDARGLSRAFGDKVVLRRSSLRVSAGEVVGLVAPNGTGKSTLLDLIAGVLDADEGSIAVGGQDITGELTFRRGVFYVPQSVKRYFAMKHPSLFCYLPDETVRDNLLAQHEGSRFSSSIVIDETLARFGLSDVAGELPASLSVGMQQRLALARALGSSHPVLLLDEPLASVDRPTRLRLLRELAQGCTERAVVYVTHDEAEIEALGGRLVHLADTADRVAAPPPLAPPLPSMPLIVAARPQTAPFGPPRHNGEVRAPAPGGAVQVVTSTPAPAPLGASAASPPDGGGFALAAPAPALGSQPRTSGLPSDHGPVQVIAAAPQPAPLSPRAGSSPTVAVIDAPPRPAPLGQSEPAVQEVATAPPPRPAPDAPTIPRSAPAAPKPAPPTNGGGAPRIGSDSTLPIRKAAAAAAFEAAGVALEALARPPAGRRGVREITAELAGSLLEAADRIRSGR